MFVGLPVELHSSHVRHITARIPWPNPLTSTLGLSLQSLHLTLDLLDKPPSNQTNQPSNLADSVASVAAEFLHDELSPGEEATLRESFHPDWKSPPNPGDYVPGGIDPFINTEEHPSRDTDPDGVGIFASLIERLLARFSFDAADTRITIRHREHSSFTLNLPNIRYETESGISSANDASTPQATLRNDLTGETRTITISEVEISMLDLRNEDTAKPAIPSIVSSVNSLPSHPPYGQLPREPCSRSPSPDSDIDDETQMMMSHSIAFLPPQPVLSSVMSASVASSMYQSAVSEVSTATREPVPEIQDQLPLGSSINPGEPPSPTPHDQRPSSSNVSPLRGAGAPEETVLSFGSDPIVIRLTTPPPSEGGPGQERTEERDGSLRLSVTTGVLSFALRARHIQSLTELATTIGNIIPASPPPSKPQGTTPTSPLLSRLNISVQIRGMVGLFLLSNEPTHELTRLDFFHHPLIPPKLPCPYLRMHADGISSSFYQQSVVDRSDCPTSGTMKGDASLTITDLTAFFFDPSNSSPLGSEHSASPVLITDPNILAQYTPSHAHPANRHNPYPNYPAFDVLDWTTVGNNSTTPKPSYWRARIPQNYSQQRTTTHRRGSSVGVLGFSPSPGKSSPDFFQKPPVHSTPAVSVAVTTIYGGRKPHKGDKVPESRTHVEVKVAPLHVFVGLGALLSSQDYGLLGFIQDSTPTSLPSAKGNTEGEPYGETSDEEEKDTPPATPRHSTGFSRRDSERQRERQRLEQMVLDDLDLKFDYRSSTPKQSSQPLPSEKVKAWREVVNPLFFSNTKLRFISVTVPLRKRQPFDCRSRYP